MSLLPAPDVLYCERQVVVANKPAGLLTQGPPGVDSLELRIKRWLSGAQASEKDETSVHAEPTYLGLPHRLDRPTSGVMVMATSNPVARRLAKQFELRQVDKVYWALVSGRVEPTEGEWLDFIRKVPNDSRSELAAEDEPGAQSAALRYQVLKQWEGVCWLQLHLETGRTHQIRVQASARGHPVLGDRDYGSTLSFGPQTSDLRNRWIALHARQIGLRHPVDEEWIEWTAPVRGQWNEWVGAL